jgi:adenosylcobinamide-GDP ribazoletransferase
MAESDPAPAEATAPSPAWPGWIVATAICLRLYSRLPVPPLPGERGLHQAPDFRLVPRALPFAALIVALPAALVLVATGAAGTAPLLAAGLALAALVLTTGALHEDGFADSADGLFGGRDAQQRLAIMRDSRIGSYGTLAIGLSLLLRVSALAAILDAAGGLAAAAVVTMAAAWSRLEGLYLLAEEPPARSDGAAASVGRPSGATAWIACGLSLAIAFGLALATSLPVAGLTLGLALAHAGTLFLARLSRRLIGGQTGDIIGAAQQLSEIAIYAGFAFVLGAG